MTVKIERRWTLVAFKHPDLEHSVYYRKGIVHLDKAVKTAESKGANLMSIRGFDISVEYGPKIKPIDGQESLEIKLTTTVTQDGEGNISSESERR